MPDRTDAPDAESTAELPHASGLPDDPNLEMELARCRTPWDEGGGDEPDPPTGAALFPEIPTWTDEQLVVAIELADLREPGLNLDAVGNLPDRHEAFLHACSAELVRRLPGASAWAAVTFRLVHRLRNLGDNFHGMCSGLAARPRLC